MRGNNSVNKSYMLRMQFVTQTICYVYNMLRIQYVTYTICYILYNMLHKKYVTK